MKNGFMKSNIENTIINLEKNNIRGYYVSGAEELHALLEDLIPDGSTVGCGDSVTLEQLNVLDYLRDKDVLFYDKHKQGLNSTDKRELYLKNFRADFFVSGVNAVTETGELINIDGNGSRVAPIIYGPPKVILIAGTNKLVKNSEDGKIRARQVAAPLDSKRLNRNTPCAATGHCTDCKSPDRICNTFVMIARQFDPERIHVILVEGDYGY